MAENRFVVKVQVSLDGAGPVLVYNKDRSIREMFEGDATEAKTRRLLEGEPKGFFYAHVDNQSGKRGLILGEPAPWQTW